eukprot:11589402-Alexandrium_andersonii.AAC.1
MHLFIAMLSVVVSCSCCGCASAPTRREKAPTPPDSELSDEEPPLAVEMKRSRRLTRRQHARELAFETRGLSWPGL